MKTFSQCDYVNRLERLLGLIRITICLCNYTLSTGNLGHYPTAPQILDLHRRRSRAGKGGRSPEDSPGFNWNCREHFTIFQDTETWNGNSFTPWIPNASFSADISLDSPSGVPKYTQFTHWPVAHDFRPGPGS